MSNFVHKVKDAITDHDKPVTRSQAAEERTHGTANPFTSNYNNRQNAPGMNNPTTTGSTLNRPDDGTGNIAPESKAQYNQHANYPTSSATESQPSSYNRNSSSMPGDSSSTSTSPDINAGPHNSKIANKLDPRVDSDLDNRANPNQAPIGTQRASNTGQNTKPNTTQHQQGLKGTNQGNMPTQQQQKPLTQGQGQNLQGQGQGMGMDSHTSTEDNFNKSTQEHHSQNQPAQPSNLGQATGDALNEDHSTSTQENKSHKSTSHVSPCTTAAGTGAGAGAGEQMFQNNPAQGDFGGNAAGGSSGMNMGSAPQDAQHQAYTAPRQKFSGDVNPDQQNIARDQRAGF
jgi:hypothetical protein